ncbi:MAG: hypothetical protein HKO02_04495 [Hyphomonadaceae bacterium]|nr:hypothetical protein [Hyphomonadaceae bacterium]
MKSLSAIACAALLAFALSVAHAILKSAADGPQQSAFELYTQNVGKIGVALIFYFSVFLIYPLFLRYFPLNLFFPIYTGLTILFVAIAGKMFFDENFSTIQILGMTFIVIGIALMSQAPE